MAHPVTGHELAERLERGEVVHYPVSPFPLPAEDDRRFLCEQRLASRAHKNISYDPHTGTAAGFLHRSSEQAERLRRLLAAWSCTATSWLAGVLPRYTRHWELDRVSFRPEEEATRKLRQKARNDLLHVDAFPSRPTNGRRILRLFVNLNFTEPRVWVTSDPFPVLFARYGKEAGLPGAVPEGLFARLTGGVARVFRPGRLRRTPYDSFMLRFHDFLKADDEFQEKTRKKLWNFLPGSVWMCLTDAVSHAVLRGRYALEHSYFLAPQDLALPDMAPAAILASACGRPVLRRAA